MIPIFWRYLIKNYLKIFFLCISGFIALLLVTRLKEIARFIAISSNPKSILLFVLYQIPHILPIAIPISCLIAAILLFQKMSHENELTALRTNGLSIKLIIYPILLVSLLLSFINLYVSSELTSICRLLSKELAHEQTSLNPLVLLQRQNLLTIKNAYIDMQSSTNENKASNLLFIAMNQAHKRLMLVQIDSLKIEEENLHGKNVSMISHLPIVIDDQYDTTILENQKSMKTNALILSQLMKSSHWSINPNQLSLRMLLVRNKNQISSTKGPSFLIIEIIRRFTLAFCAFSFTVLGIAYGMEIGRIPSKKGILLASGLALLTLTSFMMAKELRINPFFSISILILPQAILIFFALKTIRKISRGIE